jgi:hypothetical protein
MPTLEDAISLAAKAYWGLNIQEDGRIFEVKLYTTPTHLMGTTMDNYPQEQPP